MNNSKIELGRKVNIKFYRRISKRWYTSVLPLSGNTEVSTAVPADYSAASFLRLYQSPQLFSTIHH